jgi:hypothetical protein
MLVNCFDFHWFLSLFRLGIAARTAELRWIQSVGIKVQFYIVMIIIRM